MTGIVTDGLPKWMLNPQDDLARAKRMLDLHGYYAVKKDRVQSVGVTDSVSLMELDYIKDPDFVEHFTARMFMAFGPELRKVIHVDVTPRSPNTDHIEYSASVDIILPRKD